MNLIDVPYICKSNAILEYVTKEVVAGTGDEYCDPETIDTISYIYLSIEQTRNSREMENPASAADIIYLRGRLVKPKHLKTICLRQREYCIKFQSSPYVDTVGMARITPEVSSRMNLESVFGTHIQIEVRLDNLEQNSTIF